MKNRLDRVIADYRPHGGLERKDYGTYARDHVNHIWEPFPGREKQMSILYEIFIVSVPEQTMEFQGFVISDNEETAKMEILSAAIMENAIESESLGYYDFVIREIGSVRKPIK